MANFQISSPFEEPPSLPLGQGNPPYSNPGYITGQYSMSAQLQAYPFTPLLLSCQLCSDVPIQMYDSQILEPLFSLVTIFTFPTLVKKVFTVQVAWAYHFLLECVTPCT